jgi:hypothetical protein
MATEYKKIVLRRGTGTPPADLEAGELAFQTDTKKLFVGTGDASPDHYKLVSSLADMGVTATAAQLNALTGLTSSSAELNTLDGFTGIVDDLNYAKDLRATGVTSVEFDYLDGVSSNIQTQIDDITNANEWTLVVETNQGSGATITIDSGNLTFNNEVYDYKFVVDAMADAADTNTAFNIQLNGDTDAGQHSYIYNISKLTGASPTGTTDTAVGEYGATGTTIETGLDLSGSIVTQGSLHFLQSEFTISRSITSVYSAIGEQNVFAFMVRGEGSVMAGEVGESNSTTYSLSKISRFTGGYGNELTGNLSSVVLGNFPDSGTARNVKVRIYRRAR